MKIVNPQILNYVLDNNGNRIKPVLYDIPPWNMDSLSGIAVPIYPVLVEKIRMIDVKIMADTPRPASQMYPLALLDVTTGQLAGSIQQLNTNSIILGRVTGGFFDHPDYDDNTIIRGYLTLWVGE